jgi:hypothetical protein
MNTISLLLRATLLIGILQIPSAIAADASPAKTPFSQLGSINGLPVLQVDGKPFFVLGAACDSWRSIKQDQSVIEFFDNYQKMNATAVGVDIEWSQIEIEEDHYDFSFLDWFIKQAESHHLKLVIKLLGHNVCGKVKEIHGGMPGGFMLYPPAYILNDPQRFQRMVLKGVPPSALITQSDGRQPPLCPNDPATLEREKKFVAKIAEHLKTTDVHHTVIMVQIDNEISFGEWAEPKPGEGPWWKTWEATWKIRCSCPLCEKKLNSGNYRNEMDFMFHSWADYLKVLTDTFVKIHPLPTYINCYGWPTEASRIFLDTCPNLTIIGLDGVSSPVEKFDQKFAWVLTGRNVPFAAECPTEVAATRYNLDIIPYYILLGHQGIGNLLWESGDPNHVIGDLEASKKYGDALYPLKNAMVPIAQARGTKSFIGWYAVRKFADGLKKDAHGNFLPPESGNPIVTDTHFAIREGNRIGESPDTTFTLHCGELTIRAGSTAAGILIAQSKNKIILATASGKFYCSGASDIKAESGRFEGEAWVDAKPFPVVHQGKDFFINVETPVVLQLTSSPARPLRSTSPQD